MADSDKRPPSLVVPMNLTALCVSPADISGSPERAEFGHVAMDFSLLPTSTDEANPPYSSQPVLPKPFETTQITPGIRLHWALPDALTRGDVSDETDKKGQVTCPPAPNRFLVVRLAASQTPEKQSVYAWVVEGDYQWVQQEVRIGRNQQSRAIPLPPDLTYAQVSPTFTHLGRVTPLAGWKESHSNPNPSGHTALGYGNESYAAAYPHCTNVFGFFDPFDPGGKSVDDGLDSLTTNDGSCVLSYLVVGWHSDARCDPIDRLKIALADKSQRDKTASAQTLAEALKATYHWAYPASVEEPGRTLYVGQLTSLEWNPKQQYLANPTNKSVGALGGTTGEALSALLAYTLQQALAGGKDKLADEDAANVETILNELQFDLLDHYESTDGLADLQDAKHERAFARLNPGHDSANESGLMWTVKRTGPKNPSEGGETKPVPDGIAQALNDLNHSQSEYDQLAVEASTRSAQLFVDWAKYMEVKYATSEGYPDVDSAHDFLDTEIRAIEALIGHDGLDGTISAAYRKLCSDNAAIVQLLSKQDQYILESAAGPRFYQPSDPVILLSGADVNPSYRYGGDGRFDRAQGKKEGNLACRLSSDITSEMTVGNKRLTAPDLPYRVQADANQTDAKDLAALVAETVFLDYNQASLLASKTDGVATAEQIQIAQYNYIASKTSGPLVPIRRPSVMQDANQPLGGSAPAFTGVAPSPVGFVFYEHPWIPMFLQWKATFVPIYPTLGTGKSSISYDENWVLDNFQLHGFQADDQAPELTYLGDLPIDDKPEMEYRGAITLTANTEINLTGQIKAYLDNHPDTVADPPAEKKMKETLRKLSDVRLSMMAQAMGGLHRQLLLREQAIQLPVYDMWAGDSNATLIAKRAANAVGSENNTVGLTNREFNPLRAGMLRLDQLWLVDAFGQVRPIDVANRDVIVSEAWKDTAHHQEKRALLPLRITQPTRLSFCYRSASEDDLPEMNRDPSSSPVFGWVLFNRLDNALAIYSAEGSAIGSFNLNGPGWQGAPGADGKYENTIDESFRGVNRYLRDFALNLGGGVPSDPKAPDYQTALANFRDQFLKDFIDTIDLGAMGIVPDSYKQDQGLSILMGRPLALVRADLRLDLYGIPAPNQSWDAFTDRINATDDGTANFAHVRFPVRLGDTVRSNDGLVGYYIEKTPTETYKTFYAPLAPSKGNHLIVTPPSKGRERLSLAPADKAPTTVVLLVDPRAPIHASTGILPVKSIAIPPAQYADAFKRIAVTFLTAPVLGGGDQVALPVPDEVGHAWSWLTLQASPQEKDKREWQTQDIVASPNTRAAFSAPPRITEGWLRLYPAETSSAPPNPRRSQQSDT